MSDLVLSAGTAARPCAGCGLELAPALLACPSCRRLVHAGDLKRLADEAALAEGAGDLTRALALWRGTLPLLPAGTRQHAAVLERIDALGRAVDGAPGAPRPARKHSSHTGLKAGAAGLGALGLFLLKFKGVLFFLLTKAKLLLLGFTKLGTLSTMFLSFGFYWDRWGWALAAGLIISLYIHEMGHVAALRRYGIDATAPMFVPGLGALVLLKEHPASPREDARVGLAGPVWGLGAAIAAYGMFLATGAQVWVVIAKWGAVLNLFNLLPVWQLDGGRAFNALTKNHRWHAAALVLAAWLVTREGMLLIVLAGCIWQLFRPAPRQEDRGALGLYAFLVLALAAFTLLPAPVL